MSSKRLARRKGVVSSGAVNSRSNSLDWDSPSTKTGTVKRRPVSSDCSTENELNLLDMPSGNLPTPSEIKGQGKIHKATLTSPIKSPDMKISARRGSVTSRQRFEPEDEFKQGSNEQSVMLANKFLPWMQYHDDPARSESPFSWKRPEDDQKYRSKINMSNIPSLRSIKTRKGANTESQSQERGCATNSCLNAAMICDFRVSSTQLSTDMSAKRHEDGLKSCNKLKLSGIPGPGTKPRKAIPQPEDNHYQKPSGMLHTSNLPTPKFCITEQPRKIQHSSHVDTHKNDYGPKPPTKYTSTTFNPSRSSVEPSAIKFPNLQENTARKQQNLLMLRPNMMESSKNLQESNNKSSSTPRGPPEDVHDHKPCVKRTLINIPTLISSAIYRSPKKDAKNWITEDDQDQKRNKLNLSNTGRLGSAGARICQPAKSASPHRKSASPSRDEGGRGKIKEVNCIQESNFKVDGFGFDNPKCLSLTEANAYLIERKASGFNFGKAGIVSDSDSGIASPLSPSSLYGFVVWGDKNEGSRRDVEVWMELERLRSCSCVNQQVQVKFNGVKV